MPGDRADNTRPRLAQGLASAGSRAAARTLRPLSDAVAAATSAGINLERRTLDRVLESDEFERILMTALESRHLQASLRRVMESHGAGHLIDSLFDSGLFDHLVDRLLASEGLWRLVDEIAASPAVSAAISQQGLGFADRFGDELRSRSRSADDRLERLVDRVFHRDAAG